MANTPPQSLKQHETFLVHEILLELNQQNVDCARICCRNALSLYREGGYSNMRSFIRRLWEDEGLRASLGFTGPKLDHQECAFVEQYLSLYDRWWAFLVFSFISLRLHVPTSQLRHCLRPHLIGPESSSSIYVSLSSFIYKVLKRVHPDLGISKEAMLAMEAYNCSVLQQIMAEAAQITRYNNKDTMTSLEIQQAVKVVLPCRLSKLSIEAGVEAARKYSSFNEKDIEENVKKNVDDE